MYEQGSCEHSKTQRSQQGSGHAAACSFGQLKTMFSHGQAALRGLASCAACAHAHRWGDGRHGLKQTRSHRHYLLTHPKPSRCSTILLSTSTPTPFLNAQTASGDHGKLYNSVMQSTRSTPARSRPAYACTRVALAASWQLAARPRSSLPSAAA